MNFKILMTLILASSFSAYASDKNPFDKGALDLFADGVAREEPLLLGRASLRCAALYKILSEIQKRDNPNMDTSELDKVVNELFVFGGKVNRRVLISRGYPKADSEKIDDRTFEETKSYASIYGEWLGDNFLKKGEYLGSSPSCPKRASGL